MLILSIISLEFVRDKTNKMANKEVVVSIERLLEQEVREISRTGEESYIKPLTFSEELADLATRIDFHEGIDQFAENDIEKEDTESKENDTAKKEEDDSKKVPGQNPWEEVKTKLRTALSEVCVLLDVLQTVKEKKYLVLDAVNQNPEPPKPTIQMLGKRKCLARAAEVIRLGAKRMCTAKSKVDSETIDVDEAENEYYMELMKLRQLWRVKKTGSQITGDLSFKTAGSQYWHPGLFEVKKAEDNFSVDSKLALPSALTVNVSDDVQGYAKVLVQINDTSSCPVQLQETKVEKTEEIVPDWQRLMKQAQYNLFCKELFTQLSREAFQLKSVETDQVSNNMISCKLLPDVELNLSYVISEEEPIPDNCYHICRTLEHSLHALLHRQHRNNINFPTPHPSTTFWGRKSNTRPAILNLLQRGTEAPRRSLLQEFLEQARHSLLRERLNMYFDRKSLDSTQPCVSHHWNMSSSPTHSSAIINLVSENAPDRVSSSIHLTVFTEYYQVIFEDGNSIDIPPNVEDLNRLIESQITKHLIGAAKFLCQKFNWKVVQSNSILVLNGNLNDKQDSHSGIVMRSPKSDRSISLTIDSDQMVEAFLKRPPGDTEAMDKLFDSKWKNTDMVSEKVDWDKILGDNFMAKCQSLMVISNECRSLEKSFLKKAIKVM